MDVKSICDKINSMLKTVRKPLTFLPPILLYCSLARRPGLSVIVSSSKIIKSQADFGAPTGTLPDGTPNLMNQLIVNIVDEVFRALKEDSVVQLVTSPGAIKTVGSTGPTASVNFDNIGYGHVR